MNAITGLITYRSTSPDYGFVSTPGDYRRNSSDPIIKRAFIDAVRKWRMSTALMSSPEDILSDPDFRKIVDFGSAAIPLLINEIIARPSLLVQALAEITQVDPVAETSLGNLELMARDWLT